MQKGNEPVPIHGIFFQPPIEANFVGHQMSEIYRDRIFAPFVEGKNLDTIVDIGGNIGLTSYYFSRYAKRVITLEPAKEHFAVMVNMLKFNQIKNVTPINKAIYIKEGDYEFYHNENRTMYSLHQAVNTQQMPPEKVQAITLTTLFEEQNIKEVDLMKVDIEGTEFELFSGVDFKELAPKIKTIITEYHDWSGRNANQLVDVLKMRGYTVNQAQSTAKIIVASR